MKRLQISMENRKSPRLTREEWILGVLEVLQERGVEGVKVVVIAQRLGVTSGSFYWHFKTKKEFIEQLVMFWVNNETERIINLTNLKKPGLQKFKTLVALIYKQDPFLDFIFYLKRYA